MWAEAYVDGEGWISVDATTTWLGVSGDHVTLWLSEDGRVPFVYCGAPEIAPAD